MLTKKLDNFVIFGLSEFRPLFLATFKMKLHMERKCPIKSLIILFFLVCQSLGHYIRQLNLGDHKRPLLK